MMRYQRASPDSPSPLSSAKKSGLKQTITTAAAAAVAPTVCEEEGSSCSNNSNIEIGRSIPKDTGIGFEGAKGARYSCPSRTQNHLHNSTLSHSTSGVAGNGVPNSPPKAQAQSDSNHHQETPTSSETTSPNHYDVLLQWGQKKRARVSRSEIRPFADDSSLSTVPGRQPIGNKVHRRVLHATMPPPPPPSPFNRARSSTVRYGLLSSRNLDERSAAASGSPSRTMFLGTSRAASRSMAGKLSPPLEMIDRKKLCAGSVKYEKKNGSAVQIDSLNHTDSAPVQLEQAGGAANTASAAGVGEKVTVKVIDWPRIYVALSRKEKEDDFLAMKGTKLPQRPKKRAKNIDRTLQYCFPGMWLSHLTKSRYEVREKKSVKKQQKPRGLKGMECEDSDSE